VRPSSESPILDSTGLRRVGHDKRGGAADQDQNARFGRRLRRYATRHTITDLASPDLVSTVCFCIFMGCMHALHACCSFTRPPALRARQYGSRCWSLTEHDQHVVEPGADLQTAPASAARLRALNSVTSSRHGRNACPPCARAWRRPLATAHAARAFVETRGWNWCARRPMARGPSRPRWHRSPWRRFMPPAT